MKKREYNKYKIVYGEELGEKLVSLGFVPRDIRADKYDGGYLIYFFDNSYAIRLAIRNVMENK